MDLLTSEPIYFEFGDRKFPLEATAGATIWMRLQGVELNKFMWADALPTMLFAFSTRFKKNKTTQLPEPVFVEGLPSSEEIEEWLFDLKPWQQGKLINNVQKVLARDFVDPDAKPDPNASPATLTQ